MSSHAKLATRIFSPVNRPTDRVLDAGAGQSPYRSSLQGRVVALDIRPESGADVVASVEHLPFAADSFDGIVCFQVLYYLPNPRQAIEEFFRVIRPGGWLAISVSRPHRLRYEAERPGGPQNLCMEPSRVWDGWFRASGFKDATPWSFVFPRRFLGPYHFGRYRKPE